MFMKLRALKTVVASCSCFFMQIFQCAFSLRCHDICWCAVLSFLSLYLFSVLIISVPLIRGQGVAILWSCLSLICGGKLACDSLLILQWSNYLIHCDLHCSQLPRNSTTLERTLGELERELV